MNTMSNDSFSLGGQTAIHTWGLALRRESSDKSKQKEVNYGCLEIFNTGERGTVRTQKKGEIN